MPIARPHDKSHVLRAGFGSESQRHWKLLHRAQPASGGFRGTRRTQSDGIAGHA